MGQVSHEAAFENGAISGLDMYLPASQQPSRALLLSKYCDDNVDHLPPHNVRLKPLLKNTVRNEGYNAKNPSSMEKSNFRSSRLYERSSGLYEKVSGG